MNLTNLNLVNLKLGNITKSRVGLPHEISLHIVSSSPQVSLLKESLVQLNIRNLNLDEHMKHADAISILITMSTGIISAVACEFPNMHLKF